MPELSNYFKSTFGSEGRDSIIPYASDPADSKDPTMDDEQTDTPSDTAKETDPSMKEAEEAVQAAKKAYETQFQRLWEGLTAYHAGTEKVLAMWTKPREMEQAEAERLAQVEPEILNFTGMTGNNN
jgi:catalase (peroxidase I)